MELDALILPLKADSKNFDVNIAGAVAGVTALVGTMGAAIKMTFDWAGELDSIGDVMDVTNDEAAALNFTLRKSGVDTNTFTKGIVILNKGLVKADGTLDSTGKALKNWGINVLDANGQLKDQSQLIDDVAAKYATFGTQQEKVNFLTEVFGKSGAELIDFFDVLAAEGGMDAVTEKVKAFGLAIDPARYENFTRNLEEIKLMGLGLAVAFTEQVMPVLENVLGWASRFIQAPIEDKFAMLADPAKLLFNLTDWFKQATDEVDWAGISTELATKIQNIDWNLVGSYVRTGFKNIFDGLSTIFTEVNWEALGTSLADASNEMFAGVLGYESFEELADNVIVGWDFVVNSLMQEIGTSEMLLGGTWDEMLLNAFDASSFDDIKEQVVNKLEEIRAAVMAKINEILAALSPLRSGQYGAALGGFGGSVVSGSSSGGSANRRASGGPVIAGQQYDVAEFFRPERFTPSTNGRVDPMQPAAAFAGGMGEDVFIQRMVDGFARAIRSELQKSGRK